MLQFFVICLVHSSLGCFDNLYAKMTYLLNPYVLKLPGAQRHLCLRKKSQHFTQGNVKTSAKISIQEDDGAVPAHVPH